MNHLTREIALSSALAALTRIATPVRPDGTYNLDRRACELLAKDALQQIELLSQDDAPSQPQPASRATSVSGGYVVYTDGACKGNPGPAGWGAVLTEGGAGMREAFGYLGEKLTNNIAELNAAIGGLLMTPAGATVKLFTDSQYTIKGVTDWRKGWERKGWLTTGGEPVKNKDLWQQLYALVDARTVTMEWVRGHSGDPMNELADQLANKAIATMART